LQRGRFLKNIKRKRYLTYDTKQMEVTSWSLQCGGSGPVSPHLCGNDHTAGSWHRPDLITGNSSARCSGEYGAGKYFRAGKCFLAGKYACTGKYFLAGQHS
jgi:hypothetical protein